MEIEATVWRRFGLDRTYLKDTDGNGLGWIDNKTGVLTVESSEHRSVIEDYVRIHLLSQSGTTMTELKPTPIVEKALEPPSQNRYREPGAEALKRAAELPREQAEPWLMGAAGEQAVASTLNALPAPWKVFHAIPIGDPDRPLGDIDHLVIGSSGVYSINAKHHPGQLVQVRNDTFLVDHRSVPYIASARKNAMTVATRMSAGTGLPIQVQAVIAVVDADEVVVTNGPRDVMIMARGQLLEQLTRRRSTMNIEKISALVLVANSPETWR
ncbi:MAG TPA: nuclease-related domain-containing protein [Candidatus Nanopelagicaceae bacterium]|nr:nuclease-related domain-containing protein [Candidatus Nanopelagicaceae bacterium]